jgi:hypothetical protein
MFSLVWFACTLVIMAFLKDYLEAPKVLERKLRETPCFLDTIAERSAFL